MTCMTLSRVSVMSSEVLLSSSKPPNTLTSYSRASSSLVTLLTLT